MSKKPRVLLIFPPRWDCTSPYLALPKLAGYLKAHGVAVKACDLNVAGLCRADGAAVGRGHALQARPALPTGGTAAQGTIDRIVAQCVALQMVGGEQQIPLAQSVRRGRELEVRVRAVDHLVPRARRVLMGDERLDVCAVLRLELGAAGEPRRETGERLREAERGEGVAAPPVKG